MGSNLQVGLYIPNGDGLMSPVARRWTDVVELATTAEEIGFDSVWVADHMIFDFGTDPVEGRWECWTILAAIAAATKRVQMGPLVTCMGFRNPGLLAKTAETVDEISNGRLILALGAGWHEPEFTTYGFAYDHRVSRFEEAFEALRGLIREGETDFNGSYYQMPNCKVRPRGPRDGKMPIIVGTDGDRMLRLTAKHADGWNTVWTHHPDELIPRIARVNQICDEVGREPATLSRSACVFVDLPGASGVYLNGKINTPNPLSSVEIAKLLRGYEALGIDHVMLWLDPGTVAGVRQFEEALAQLRA